MIDVSVVVPCYNAQDFIEDCITSIANQIDVTVEILAVEDRSTDRTWDLLQNLAGRFSNLHLQRMDKNSGQATARNVAMAQAKGRYIALLDSDDSYRQPDVLKQWVAAADQDNLDLCIAGYTTQFEDGRQERNSGVPLLTTADGVGSALTSPEIANTAQSWQILFRRTFLTDTGLRFSQKLRQREDRLFFIEAFCHAKRIGVIALDAITYRVHPGSTMRRRDYDQLAQFNLHMELMDVFMTQARAEGRISAAFERANAIAYWRQAMEYWNDLLIPVLAAGPENWVKRPSAEETEIAETFLARLHALTRHCGPLYRDQAIRKRGTADKMKAEGVFDMARLTVATGRKDVLLQLLRRRQRVHHSVLRDVVDAAQLDWGEAAAMQYTRYSRNADFREERVTDDTPPLASLVKRVILHVGTPKTGSSSMQEFLENNRFRLLDQGIWYPIFGANREQGMRRHRSAGHLSLVRELVQDDTDHRGKRLAAEIAALGKPIHTLVLSSENVLSHAIWPEKGTGDPIRMIVEKLGLKEVEVAMVLRRQDAWFQSYYRELLCNPFNHFLASPMTFFEDLSRRGLFDYDDLTSHIAASPHVSRTHVTSFGDMRAAGGSIPWMLDLLGHDGAGLEGSAALTTNESLTDAMAGNIRMLKMQHPFRWRVAQFFDEITTAQELRDAPYTLISSDDWDRIDARLAAHLAAFDARFPGERPAKRPGPEDAASLPVLPLVARNEPDHLWLGLADAEDDDPMGQHLSRVLGNYRSLIDEHDYMIKSKSWQLTAPLRGVLSAGKALRDRLRKPR